MQSLKRSMQWDEDVFGLEYDLDIYNIVAVSDFNMGAMENKGLNIFNTKYVLASEDTATDADFGHVEGVIGHEYFHNWTGNRVTCRDWFQLSLKEGLTVFRDQEFSSDMASREVKRIDDVRVLRLYQFAEDGGPLAHPVRPESYFEINNFYTMTVYNKGAEVIRMIQTFLGVDVFRQAVRHYLAKFDGQAVTCEDFVCAMEEKSGKDLSQFRLWYSQAGTPTISIKRTVVEGGITLSVEQSCPDTPGQTDKKPFHLPLLVGWLDQSGQSLTPEVIGDARWTEQGCLLDVSQASQQFHFKGLDKLSIPSLLRNFTAPVNLDGDLSTQEKALLLRYDTDSYARWQAGQDLYSTFLLKSVNEPAWEKTPDGLASLTMIKDAFEAIIDDASINSAFAAELLMLPSEIYLGQQMEVLNSDGIHVAREKLLDELAGEFREKLLNRYQQLTNATKSAGADIKSDRRLRNTLLGFIAQRAVDDFDCQSILLKHYSVATNMTDCMGALVLIAGCAIDKRDQILSHFYDRWHHDDLVIDKWFAVQAQSKCKDTFERVSQLLQHPAFSLKNPNRLRSLISTFSMANQVHFHHESGQGYDLLMKTIGEVDKINPQTAAKMVAPLGRWSRLDAGRKEKMIFSLKRLKEKVDLSEDVRELVEKSLTSS
jgi:aminopeptidase N